MAKKHGVNIPVFSLRSENRGGIGEFLDLIPLIRWLKSHGFSVLQLLPLNDSGLDPSPYNNLSAFALNPVYIHYKGFDAGSLNELERVPYKEIYELKDRFFFEKVYPAFKPDQKFHYFLETNPWITEYATFKALKRKYDNRNWSLWPSYEVSQKDIKPYFVQQYLAFSQMGQVKQEATNNGIELMGDIPILISPDSDAAWSHPEYFNFSLEAGAPPDQYSREGQKWGFPLYRWEVLEDHDFDWWKSRLRVASQLYNSYRIDHIVGFFRIWAMRVGAKPLDGQFFPHDERDWIPQGLKLLRMMLNSNFMIPIGEDLGVIPNGVREVLHTLAIPGTKVIRWERKWHEGGGFIPFREYPELSLTTVSTHDSELLREWWEKCPDEARMFCQFMGWEKTEKLSPSQIQTILRLSHETPSRYTINLLPEYLSLVPELSFENPDQDRINVPGTVGPHNWSYRMKPTLEEMIKNPQLGKALETILPP